jgi:phage terminase small subunit
MTRTVKASDTWEPTYKMERFVAEYIVDGNGSRAAKAAGYSAKTADRMAWELLRNPNVQKMVKQQLAEQQKRTLITADEVLKRIDRVARKAEAAGDFSAATRANQLIGQHYKLFTEKHEHGGLGGGPVLLQITEKEADL